QRLPIVFPVHPRTAAKARARQESGQLMVTDPLGYLDFLALTAGAALVLTDSGGLQEETTILNIPCLTLRENTERPITITHGTNMLVGTSPNDIRDAAEVALAGAR